MSYQFSVVGTTKAAALALATTAMAEIAAAQPVHVADQSAALENAQAALDAAPDPTESQSVQISMNGTRAGSWSSNIGNAISSMSLSMGATVSLVDSNQV